MPPRVVDPQPIRILTGGAYLGRAGCKPSRRKGIAVISLGILLASCRCALALNPALEVSQYAHTSWKSRDGFPGSIHSIAQTPDGYLWLGTELGLLRYDGVRRPVPGLPPDQHLPSNTVNRLLVARDGTLWIGTWKGLASWKDGRLTQYPQLAGEIVFRLIEDHEGTVWAAAAALTPPGKLCSIHNGNVKCDSTLGNVIGLYEDRKGNLWAGTRAGLWRWKPGPPEFYPLPGEPSGISNIAEDTGGALLIFYGGRIARLVNGKAQTAYTIPGPGRASPSGGNMLRDRDGGLWISTEERGLVHIHDGRTDVFSQSDGLSGDSVNALFEDREGNFWVGTMTGLDRFRDNAVVTLSVNQGLRNFPRGSFLIDRDGSIWLDTNDGLSKWKNGRVTIYRTRGRPVTHMFSLCQDDKGRLWVAGFDGVGYVENDRLIPIDGVPGGVALSVASGTAGNLWLAFLHRGLVQLRGSRMVSQIPWTSLGHKDSAVALASDPADGGLWLGFSDGGLVYLKDGQARSSYTARDGLGQGGISSLQLDTDGTLWAATEGGFSRLKNGRVATLTGKNGLPCDGIAWSMEDDAHSFWLYTDCGLVRIARYEFDAWASDPSRTVHAAVFDSSDGVHKRAVNPNFSPSVTKSPDGRIWFTTYDGISTVADPRHLPFNRLPPPVRIERITADRTTYETASSLRLPPLVRDLEIDYTALSLVSPEKIRFKYKLEGKDPDWTDAGDRRQAFYNDLAPNNYRFRVIACNNSGVWNQAGASFDFSIDPVYYQTSWFQTSCGVAFLALLWGLYRYRLHQVARAFNMRLEERVGERTRLARDLHDTLLQGFQGLMLRLQAIDESLPPGEVKDELERTLDRGDQVVAESRKAVHDLRLSTLVTNDMARAIRTMGGELSSEGSAAFELLVEGETRELHPIVRDEVYRITREALRNAFIHARARHIEAEITYGEQLFRLRIRDDGAGIAPAILEEGRAGHYGLPGMRERAAGIGAKLDIWSGAGTGTEIDLSIAGSIAYGKRPGRSRLRVFPEKAE